MLNLRFLNEKRAQLSAYFAKKLFHGYDMNAFWLAYCIFMQADLTPLKYVRESYSFKFFFGNKETLYILFKILLNLSTPLNLSIELF